VRSRRDVSARWEARLRAEGLASLDYPDGDDVIVSNRGSGKLHPDETADGQLVARAASESAIDHARDVLRSHRFHASLDRRIWALHADGLGTREIAKRVGFWRQGVRASLAATKAAIRKKEKRRATIETAISKSDTGFLCALFRAAAG
jgi:hypothetical protein